MKGNAYSVGRQRRKSIMVLSFPAITFLLWLLISWLYVILLQHHQVMKSIVIRKHTTETPAAVPGNNAHHIASLRYGVHLQENNATINFNGEISMEQSGHTCFSFTVPNNASRHPCPHPHIQLRLSGSALIRVELTRAPTGDIISNSSSLIELAGCTLLISGLYYVEAHLLACTCDPLVHNSSELMGACTPIAPDLSKRIRPFHFTVKPVDSMLAYQAAARHIPSRKTLFPHAAWVYAPLCKGSNYTVSSSCTRKASSTPPSFVPTKFQIEQWLIQNNFSDWQTDQKLIERMDNYVWLPINSTTGQPQYTALHATVHFTPSLPDLDPFHSQDTICFVGASHARYLRNSVVQIFYNLTAEADACYKESWFKLYEAPPDPVLRGEQRFKHFDLRLLSEGKEAFLSTLTAELQLCNHLIVSVGQYDLSWVAALRKAEGPTALAQLLRKTLDLLRYLESTAPATSNIWVTSVNTNAMSSMLLQGKDWRTPFIIDAFNTLLQNATNQDTFQFKYLNRSFFLDNRDLMDPMWDSATDWCHPCRLVMRPIAHRVLSLMRMNRFTSQNGGMHSETAFI